MKPTLLLLALTSSLFAVERLEVTDIVGSNQQAIQAAVDHMVRLGGGTVCIEGSKTKGL